MWKYTPREKKAIAALLKSDKTAFKYKSTIREKNSHILYMIKGKVC